MATAVSTTSRIKPTTLTPLWSAASQRVDLAMHTPATQSRVVDQKTERPERTCIYCGAPIYAAPKVTHVTCYGCMRVVCVQNLVLRGEVMAQRTVTAGSIVVAPDARIAGDLVATRVHVAGRVLGNILANQDCVIESTGKVAGQILCRRIRVEPGAELLGSIERVLDN